MGVAGPFWSCHFYLRKLARELEIAAMLFEFRCCDKEGAGVDSLAGADADDLGICVTVCVDIS